MLLRHHEWIVEHFGEECGNILMRRYACNYATGKRGAREFRGMVTKCCTSAEFRHIVEVYFPMSAGKKPQ